MQVIKPFDITDATMTNTIPEPDTARGEVEWESSRDSSVDIASIITNGGIAGIAEDGSYIYVLSKGGGAGNPSVYQLNYDYTGTGNTWTPGATFDDITYAEGFFYMLDGGVDLVKFDTSFSEVSRQDITADFDSLSAVFGLTTDGRNVYAFGSVTSGSRVVSYNSSLTKSGINFNAAPPTALNIAFLDNNLYLQDFSAAFFYKYSIEGIRDDSYLVTNVQDIDGYEHINGKFIGGVTSVSPAVNKLVFFYDSMTSSDFYDIGERVMKASTHKVYEAALVTNEDPEIGVNKIPPSWTEVSATNKYKAFDYVKNLQAIGSSPLVVTLTPGKLFSALAGFNISGADNINITVNDPTDGEVYNKDIPMNDVSGIVNMWQYFFYEPSFIEQFVVDDLPPYKDATITITFTGSGDISIGELAYGRSRNVGVTVYGSSYDRKSYSNIETDDFGNETVTLRPSASYTSFEVSLETSTASYVEKVLKDVLDIPTLYIGDSVDGEKIIDLGYYERSALVLSNPARSEISIKVRGLV